MTWTEVAIAVFIHLIVPLLGVSAYLMLLWKMSSEGVDNFPFVELFLIFATYGGLLILLLTSLLWVWSGMASLGTIYLVLLAPIVMGIIAYLNFKDRKISRYHRYTYISALLYFVITPLTFLGLILLDP